ncbi:DNA replication complex subunit Gins51 [Natrarchaeobaculum sulfurireducens]|uniref:DNA replication initiation complex subunit, GINS15 family n=1 Tax=Natrarchaeobaculum sulfurireducens TaxID=2044521 RepID=A0A346PRD3_9EURY|nr:hypothetical protein [Natrarchaeobaculum sulfurireducens]AXR77930.1 DNA replication initiation complex subunit, GINS15 family [Natrarchaeobaculum sulfurireducens]AXR82078.1 hypothetical protein AArcMg_2080 [Natrarchaeobaculum sulfurireducens]
MNLDELRSVQSTERTKDSLQNLRPSFYQEVGEYIVDLEAERDRLAAQVDDPFSSPEVGRLTDEIETAKDVVEAIYERRMGKLVKQASLAAAGMHADDEGLTAEEQDLFSDLVDRIGSNKSRVLDVLEGNASEPVSQNAGAESTDDAADPEVGTETSSIPPEPDSSDEPPVPPEVPPSADDSSGLSPVDAMGGGPPLEDNHGDEQPQTPDDPASGDRTETGSGPAGKPSPEHGEPENGQSADDSTGIPGTDVDRATVRITQDLGSILGVDAREYVLETDDIVTLPEENAAPLIEREAAERLE